MKKKSHSIVSQRICYNLQRKNMTKLYFFIFIFVIYGVQADDISSMPKESQLTFSYSETNLKNLTSLPCNKDAINTSALTNISKDVDYVLFTNKLSSTDEVIILPYLANAQKDFALLSYLYTGKLKGNFGPITLWTLQLFIPNASLPSITEEDFDVFSSTLAVIVLEQVVKRFNQEKTQLVNYRIQKGEDMWSPTSPGYVGLNFGSIKTWYLNNSQQFLAETPPKEKQFWKDECNKIKMQRQLVGKNERNAIFEWAGLSSIKGGDWNYILTKYLEKKPVPILTELYLRAVLLSAISDSVATAFNSKYTFWVMRPSQMDPTLSPVITVPNHPSYPSGHSTIAGTAATILTSFFPQDANFWKKTAEEAGMSRIWGEIHYPIDHTNGLKLGTTIGEAVLKTTQMEKK